MRNLIFVGLPGSGKSTVGRLCAKALNLPFVDADKFLEQREGRSVADIFASSGEGYFRDLESRVLAELCRREGIVLATGGGAVLRFDPDTGAVLDRVELPCPNVTCACFGGPEMEDLFITIPATPAPIITKEMIKHTFLFPRKSMAFFSFLVP